MLSISSHPATCNVVLQYYEYFIHQRHIPLQLRCFQVIEYVVAVVHIECLRSCNDFPCKAMKPTGFELMLGEWGACSSTCGPGNRTRSITCQSEDGFLGPLTNCDFDPASESVLALLSYVSEAWRFRLP